jgi:multiple sugar transport system substrate-binding protein
VSVTGMVHRKVTIGFLALLVAGVGVAGCGSKPAPPAKQDPGTPLEIWSRRQPGSPTEKTTKDLAAKFTEKTGIKANVTVLFNDFETKLTQAAQSKHLPDIVINDTDQVGTLHKQGIVREVDRKKTAGGDQLTDTAWSAAQGADGKYYGVPFSAQSFALFIRKDWREKLGDSVPQNWDDLVKLATDFTTKDPDGDGKADTYGFDIPGTTQRGYMAWYFSSYLWSAGGDFFAKNGDKYKSAVASDKSVAAVDWFKNLFCGAKVVQPGAIQADTNASHIQFESGKAGIYLTGPYMLGRFDKNLGKDKYEIVQLPAGPSGKSVSLAEGENVYEMAGSTNQAGQQKFAEYAISAEGQTLGMSVAVPDGTIVRLPVNKTVNQNDLRKDPRWDQFAQIYTKNGQYFPHLPAFTPFRQAASDTINAIVANCGSNAKAELDKLNTKFTDQLSTQGVAG